MAVSLTFPTIDRIDPYNPLVSVGGVEVSCPSKYIYKLQDVSQSNAGRTEDGKMHKLMIGQCVKIELEWQNISTEAASEILQAFNHEYMDVNYYDYKAAAFLTKRFYVGDRQVTTFSRNPGTSTIAFNIIEQ